MIKLIELIKLIGLIEVEGRRDRPHRRQPDRRGGGRRREHHGRSRPPAGHGADPRLHRELVPRPELQRGRERLLPRRRRARRQGAGPLHARRAGRPYRRRHGRAQPLGCEWTMKAIGTPANGRTAQDLAGAATAHI